MAKYKVNLVFKYTDVVHVEAENEEDAILKAVDESDPQYDSFHDAKVTEE